MDNPPVDSSSPAQLLLMYEPSYEFELSSVLIDRMKANTLSRPGNQWWVYEERDFWRSGLLQGRVFKCLVTGEGCSLQTPPPQLHGGLHLVGMLCDDFTQVSFTKDGVARKEPIKVRQDQEIHLPSGEVEVTAKDAQFRVQVRKKNKWVPTWEGTEVPAALAHYRSAPRPRRLMVVGVKEPLEEEA